jgi:hypothetical protein
VNWSIVFNPLIPMPTLLGVGALSAAVIVVSYIIGAQGATRFRRGLLATLRLGVLAAILVLLARPMMLKPEAAKSQQSTFAVLVDCSKSMNTKDVGGASRYEAVLNALEAGGNRSMLQKLGERFHVRLYGFDTRSYATTLAQLHGNKQTQGKDTSIATALTDSTGGMGLVKPKGVLLISDGRSNEPDSLLNTRVAANGLRTANVPVWTVPVGSASQVKDLYLIARLNSNYMLVNQPASILASLTGSAYSDWTAKVHLYRDDKYVTSQQVQLRNGHAEISFPVREPRKGTYQYRVDVEPLPGEADTENNRRAVIARVIDDKARVLVVESAPHWDSKFLLRALRADMNIEVTSLFQINDIKSFSIVERAADSNSPEKTVTAGATLPASKEELYKYDCIFLGKGVDDVFSSAQLKLLQGYVSERGGSVVFFRGRPYSGRSSELSRLEPVDWGSGLLNDARFELTPEGKTNPIFDYAPRDAGNDTIIRQLPSMTSITRVEGSKSLAVILAQTSKSQGPEPMATIAYQRYGKGKVMSIAAAGLWQWGFLPQNMEQYDDIYARFWNQMIRWLVSDSEFLPGQDISFVVDKNVYRPDEMVRLAVNAKFVDASRYKPTIDLTGPDGKTARLTCQRSAENGTLYTAYYQPEQEGEYKAVLHNNVGTPQTDLLRFNVYEDSLECRCVDADRELLHLVSKTTGAESFELNELGALPDKIQTFEQLSREHLRPTDVWDRLSVFTALVCLLGLEWLIRRTFGLV